MGENETNSSEGLKSLTDIDKIFYAPARVMILAYLYVSKEADFIFLRGQTGLTDGNLSSHMSKLEDADYITVKKEFKGKKPHTMYSLTEVGRNAFKDYRKKMKQVLDLSKKRKKNGKESNKNIKK